MLSKVQEVRGGEYTRGSGRFLVNPDDYNLKFHTIFVGTKGDRFSKFDFPSAKQPYYHLVFGKEGEGATHIQLPESVGKWLEPFFDHPGAMSKGLAVLGVAVSAYDVWTAYQQDAANGGSEYKSTKIAVTKELFSWGGAIAGAEAGAAIGTAFFPGVGTVVGGFVGGAVGAFGGEQIGTWAGEELFGSSISYGGYAVYGFPVGRPNLRPL